MVNSAVENDSAKIVENYVVENCVEESSDFFELVKEKSLKPTDVIWDGGSDTLEVGLTFQSRSLVKKFLSGYGDQSFCNMVVAEGGVQDGSKSRKVKN